MPTMRIDDFSGGMNQSAPNGLLQTESAILKNWYPSGKKLRRRRGIQAVTFAAAPVAIREFTVNQRVLRSGSVDERFFICGTAAGFVAYDVDTNLWVTLSGGELATSTEPWIIRQYNGTVYALRRSSRLQVMRYPFQKFRLAGLPTPSGSPAGTEVAGVLDKGYYEYVFTFRNSSTGEESVRSAALRKQATAASKGFNLSAIPQPPAGFDIDEIRIWRSLGVLDPAVPPVGEIGSYRYLDTIHTGVTTYSDTTTPPDGLGDELSKRNGIPPDGHLFEIAQERAFIADNGTVYWSEVGKLAAFYGLSFLPVFPNDGQSITALHFYDAMSAILVGKQSRIVALVSDGAGGYARTEFSESIGVASNRSMRSIGGVLIWFGGDNFYRSDNGEPPQSISTLRLRDAIAAIPANRRSEVVAALRPHETQYLVLLPIAGGYELWVYNWAMNCWSQFETELSITTLREFVSEELGEEMYALGSDGYVYQTDKGEFDLAGGGTQHLIESVYRSRQIRNQKGGMVARRVGLECSTVPASATLRIYRSDEQFASERPIPLDPGMWSAQQGRESRYKAYAVAPNDTADDLSVEIEYAGRPPVEIESVEIEVAERAGRIGVVL